MTSHLDSELKRLNQAMSVANVDFRITTMTVVFPTSHWVIIDKHSSAFERANYHRLATEVFIGFFNARNTMGFTFNHMPVVGRRQGNFSNTIQFLCAAVPGVHSKKVIKLLKSKGKIQVNGVVTRHEATEFQRTLELSLRNTFVGGRRPPIKVEEPKVHLMNCVFNSGIYIDLDKLSNLLTSVYKKEVKLDRSRYSGLIFKVADFSLAAFSTGKVLMLGGRSCSGCLDAFSFVMEEIVTINRANVLLSADALLAVVA